MPVITTLGFKGRTEEALTFYAGAMQAKTVFLMRFRDCPDPALTAGGPDDLVFHATFRIAGTTFMASDVGYTADGTAPAFAGFSLALQLDDVATAQRYFTALSHGGNVVVPLAGSEFTSWYGIVEDRFGVSWKINVDTNPPE